MSVKILYLAPGIGLTIDQSGGAGTHMRGTIKGLEENGFEVMPIIGGDIFNSHSSLPQQSIDHADAATFPIKASPQSFIKKLLPAKIRLLARDLRTIWQDYKLQQRTFEQIKTYRPDVIYERSAYLSTYGSRIARELGIPHFLETDGCMVEIINNDYGVFSKRIGNWIERKKLLKASWVVVMNRMAIGMVSSKFELPPDKFVVKRLGISDNAFPYDKDLSEQLRSFYKLNGKLVIGFVGAVSSYHGVNYLVDAALQLQAEKCDAVVIVIVGWSKEAEQLKQYANNHALTNVIFTGKVDKNQVANYYKLFDIGVIPDAEEGIYPIKVLEYGLFELCPLVPEYDIFKEIVTEKSTGYHFIPKSAPDLAAVIKRIRNEREYIREYARNWSVYVRENFQWKDTLKEIAKVIDENASAAHSRKN